MSAFDRLLCWVMLLVSIGFLASLLVPHLETANRALTAPIVAADH